MTIIGVTPTGLDIMLAARRAGTVRGITIHGTTHGITAMAMAMVIMDGTRLGIIIAGIRCIITDTMGAGLITPAALFTAEAMVRSITSATATVITITEVGFGQARLAEAACRRVRLVLLQGVVLRRGSAVRAAALTTVRLHAAIAAPTAVRAVSIIIAAQGAAVVSAVRAQAAASVAVVAVVALEARALLVDLAADDKQRITFLI